MRTRLGRSKGLDGKFNKIRRIMMGLMNKSVCPIHYNEPTLICGQNSGPDEYWTRWLCELNDLRTRCWNKLVWMEKYDGLDDWDRVIRIFRTRCWMKKYPTSWLLIPDDATDSLLNSEEVKFFFSFAGGTTIALMNLEEEFVLSTLVTDQGSLGFSKQSNNYWQR